MKMGEVQKNYDKNSFYTAKNFINSVVDNLKRHFDDQLDYLQQEIPIDIYDSMRLLHKTDIKRYGKTTGSL